MCEDAANWTFLEQADNQVPTSTYPDLYPTLLAYIQSNVADPPPLRCELLDRMSRFIRAKDEAGQTANLVFICTHNSRRSHLAALWAQAAAAYYGLHTVRCFSGGTEATAFYPSAVNALRKAGFQITAPARPVATNPRYQVRLGSTLPAIEAFSKTFSDPPNPRSDFAALMTCSEAATACPIVPGASVRVPLSYRDPKEADGTPEESARYSERSRQICQEMLYAVRRAADATSPLPEK